MFIYVATLFFFLASVILLTMFLRVTTLALLLIPNICMAASVTAVAGLGANVARVDNQAWLNPTNIQINDGTYAEVDLSGSSSSDDSDYLRGTNFGFAIPSGSTITGIVVSMGKYRLVTGSNDDVTDTVISLVIAGTVTGNNLSVGAILDNTAERTDTYGSTTDISVWGLTPTAAQINASDFGVVYAANQNGHSAKQSDVFVDDITVTVYYTEAVPDLHEWAMIFLVIGGVYFLYREGMLDGMINQY